MAANSFGKALGALGMSPSVVEVFFTNHEQEANKAKFADYLAKYGISYDTDDEYQMRMDIYVENDKYIQEANLKQSSYTLNHNHLSTLTNDEYSKMMSEDVSIGADMKDKYPELNTSSLGQAEIDWVAAGHVTPIQNQLTCGSCWAFAAVSTIESHNSIINNQLLKLSEQQLVDCTTWGANGCEGGNFVPAYWYASQNPVQLASSYPYVNAQTPCTADASLGKVQLDGWWTVRPNSVDAIKGALTMGPVGIAVQAYNRHFQLYSSGILDTTECGQAVDHAVDAVGWGTFEGQEYLMIKNSWGTSWGDDGYMYIALNDQSICGILLQPFMPRHPTMV